MRRFYPKYDPSLALASLCFAVAVSIWLVALGAVENSGKPHSPAVVVGTIMIPMNPSLQLASSVVMALH